MSDSSDYYERFQSPPDDVDGDNPTVPPELMALVDELADECAKSLSDGETVDDDQIQQIVEALATNGWMRHSKQLPPLSTIVETRTREKHLEPAMHRGGGLKELCVDIQKRYDDVARYRSSAPDNERSPSEDPAKGPSSPRAGVRD